MSDDEILDAGRGDQGARLQPGSRGQRPGERADDPALGRGDRRHQPALAARARLRGAAGDGPGVDDVRPQPRAPAGRAALGHHGASSTAPATRPCSAPTATRPTRARCGPASGSSISSTARGGRRPEEDRRRRGLLRHDAQHLDGAATHRRRSRRCCSGCSSSSPARAARRSTGRRRCGRWSTATPRSSGRARRRASCGSRSATPAASCGTRPARCARRATRWTAATSWRPDAAGCTRSWCTTRPSSPASSCPSRWPWSSSTRASG